MWRSTRQSYLTNLIPPLPPPPLLLLHQAEVVIARVARAWAARWLWSRRNLRPAAKSRPNESNPFSKKTESWRWRSKPTSSSANSCRRTTENSEKPPFLSLVYNLIFWPKYNARKKFPWCVIIELLYWAGLALLWIIELLKGIRTGRIKRYPDAVASVAF